MAKPPEGWICLHRKITEWEWYDDANTFRLFIHCLLRANHEPSKWRGVAIERGQFISSVAKLSAELKLTNKQIRGSLEKLKRTNEVASESCTQFTVFTVKNYHQYQSEGKRNGEQRASETANEGQTEGKRRATNNNDNNNNKEDYIPETGPKSAKPNGSHHNTILFEQIVELYNEILGDQLPRVATLNETRKRLLKARCAKQIGKQDANNPDFWKRCFTFIAKDCPWLTGENPKNWTANFDWIINETNFIKIVEGNYQRGAEQHGTEH